MTTMRLHSGDTTLYEGPPVPVPDIGDSVVVDEEAVRVEARTWTLSADDVVVELLLAPVRYTA